MVLVMMKGFIAAMLEEMVRLMINMIFLLASDDELDIDPKIPK